MLVHGLSASCRHHCLFLKLLLTLLLVVQALAYLALAMSDIEFDWWAATSICDHLGHLPGCGDSSDFEVPGHLLK